MKTVKKIFLYLLIACVIFTPYNVSAQIKDVTKAKSEDMKQIINAVSYLPAINLYFGEKKLSFDTKTKSVMASALTTYTVAEKTSLTQAKKNMKLLFGSSQFKLSKSHEFPYSLFEQKGKTIYYYGGGEWGDCGPYFKIKKITQTSKERYICSVNYYVENPDGIDYIGNFTYELKTAKNKYGYIITDIKQNTKCGYRKHLVSY